ncbi:MAG: response regulator transcription factor [Deltaproteobacteria bacterium]|nr:response regulator transcription factor [Deltaproteobacteria bacterium]
MPRSSDTKKKSPKEDKPLNDIDLRTGRPSPLRVLLVEDDDATAKVVSHYFIEQGVPVVHSVDGPSALTALRERTIDVIVLDIILPGPDGLEVCRQIRENSDVPIILLSAKVSEADRLIGFEAGADDYVTKPFSTKELFSRVVALVRRARGQVGPIKRSLVVEDVVLEPGALRAVRAGRDLNLTSYEFNILYALAERRGRVCTREALIEAAGGTAEGAFERSIDVHVSRVRQKLGDDARQPQILKTVRGTGYLFARPASEEG